MTDPTPAPLVSEHLDPADIARFDAAVEQPPALLETLCSAPRHRLTEHATVPNTPGIYLFSDGERPIYVGQSRKLRSRLRQHTGATQGHNQASFAFNIAKRAAAAAPSSVPARCSKPTRTSCPSSTPRGQRSSA